MANGQMLKKSKELDPAKFTVTASEKGNKLLVVFKYPKMQRINMLLGTGDTGAEIVAFLKVTFPKLTEKGRSKLMDRINNVILRFSEKNEQNKRKIMAGKALDELKIRLKVVKDRYTQRKDSIAKYHYKKCNIAYRLARIAYREGSYRRAIKHIKDSLEPLGRAEKELNINVMVMANIDVIGKIPKKTHRRRRSVHKKTEAVVKKRRRKVTSDRFAEVF